MSGSAGAQHASTSTSRGMDEVSPDAPDDPFLGADEVDGVPLPPIEEDDDLVAAKAHALQLNASGSVDPISQLPPVLACALHVVRASGSPWVPRSKCPEGSSSLPGVRALVALIEASIDVLTGSPAVAAGTAPQGTSASANGNGSESGAVAAQQASMEEGEAGADADSEASSSAVPKAFSRRAMS